VAKEFNEKLNSEILIFSTNSSHSVKAGFGTQAMKTDLIYTFRTSLTSISLPFACLREKVMTTLYLICCFIHKEQICYYLIRMNIEAKGKRLF